MGLTKRTLFDATRGPVTGMHLLVLGVAIAISPWPAGCGTRAKNIVGSPAGTGGRSDGAGGQGAAGASGIGSGGDNAAGGGDAGTHAGSVGGAGPATGQAGVAGSTVAETGGRSASGGSPAGAGGVGAGGGGNSASGGGGGMVSAIGGAAGAAGAGGFASGSPCVTCQPLEQCVMNSLCVAKSIPVAAGFSVDATEVTRAQYSAWLATKPVNTGQPAACSWNANFAPDATCMTRSSVCQGTGCGRHPQPCVDLCDAAAYCRAVGKRLCGRIGGGAVSYDVASTTDPAQSQWFNACSSNGVNTFTYGASRVAGNCNDYLINTTTTIPVASKPQCQSTITAYVGIFDLIGNVAEWEDNCNATLNQMDTCKVRGFSFGAGAALPTCAQDVYANRGDTKDNIGFRCCTP